MNTFHITNGDCSLHNMRKAGVEGEILPWRDVLHDGPVPAGNDLEKVSITRANFIASAGWGTPEEVQLNFSQRDQMLLAANDYDRIVLWFELDLYDQLQILQLLNWLAEQAALHDKLYLICHHHYLGSIETEEMASLIGTEKLVTKDQLKLAQSIWQAFTKPNPTALAKLYNSDTSALPYMHAAIGRLLEFYPAPKTGLNRTEKQILEAINRGITAIDVLFEVSQQAEASRFMGDGSFWMILEELSNGDQPLVLTQDKSPFQRAAAIPYTEDFRALRLKLTDDAHNVLAHNSDALALRKIDRWIGGTHLTNDNLWYWDNITGQLIR